MSQHDAAELWVAMREGVSAAAEGVEVRDGDGEVSVDEDRDEEDEEDEEDEGAGEVGGESEESEAGRCLLILFSFLLARSAFGYR